jgi:dTMP kinase
VSVSLVWLSIFTLGDLSEGFFFKIARSNKPVFITLEGIEGCGKTTQLDHISAFLKKEGRPSVVTREPGGTGIGGKIRSILLDPASKDLVPTAELLLYMADRAQHINAVIKPHLAQGKILICDRYYDATVAYQGFARGLGVAFIRDLHRMILDDFKPDLTILLDLPPRSGLSRAWRELENGSRSGSESRFEAEAISFHEKVRTGYLELAKMEPQRFRIIDASRSIREVQSEIQQMLSAYL